MGTTNKLLQRTLRKRTHISRQHEAAIIIYHDAGLNRPNHHYQIVQDCISNDSDGMEDDVLWSEQYDKSDTDSNEDMYDT